MEDKEKKKRDRKKRPTRMVLSDEDAPKDGSRPISLSSSSRPRVDSISNLLEALGGNISKEDTDSGSSNPNIAYVPPNTAASLTASPNSNSFFSAYTGFSPVITNTSETLTLTSTTLSNSLPNLTATSTTTTSTYTATNTTTLTTFTHSTPRPSPMPQACNADFIIPTLPPPGPTPAEQPKLTITRTAMNPPTSKGNLHRSEPQIAKKAKTSTNRADPTPSTSKSQPKPPIQIPTPTPKRRMSDSSASDPVQSPGTNIQNQANSNKYPPIHIYTQKHTEVIRLITTNVTPTPKFKFNNSALVCHAMTDISHQFIAETLKANNIDFYTYSLTSFRPVKIVIKYIPLDTPNTEIEADLRRKNLQFISMARIMLSRNGRKFPSNILLLTIPKEAT